MKTKKTKKKTTAEVENEKRKAKQVVVVVVVVCRRDFLLFFSSVEVFGHSTSCRRTSFRSSTSPLLPPLRRCVATAELRPQQLFLFFLFFLFFFGAANCCRSAISLQQRPNGNGTCGSKIEGEI